MTRLAIQILQAIQGVDASAGAVARIFRSDTQAKHFEPISVVVPVTNGSEWKEVKVEPGPYVVEARLASGVIARQHVRVPKGGARVTLHGPKTPSENLAWQAVVSPQRALLSTGVPLGKTPRVTVAVIERPPPDPWASLATLARSPKKPSLRATLAALGDTHVVERHRHDDWTSGKVDLHRWRSRTPAKRTVVIVERGDSLEIASLPSPWVIGEQETATVELAVPTDPDEPLGIAVQDSLFGSVVGYMANGSVEIARSLLDNKDTYEHLERALYRKRENPYAAALGACVLVLTSSRRDANWDNWLDNLTKWFEWLPDGAAVRGVRMLRKASTHSDLRAALASLSLAYARGLPVFSPIAHDQFSALSALVMDPSFDSRSFPEDRLTNMRSVMLCLQPNTAVTILRFQPHPVLEVSVETPTKKAAPRALPIKPAKIDWLRMPEPKRDDEQYRYFIGADDRSKKKKPSPPPKAHSKPAGKKSLATYGSKKAGAKAGKGKHAKKR